ncbi:MAG: hypothetical protein H7A35_14980 [Planctomycetales bacterium]|nr:hypothetical protein [bacterium]UNM08135.1 MAG: hypothetical protein H7A35_14980 [Planctomycetales bacterium]
MATDNRHFFASLLACAILLGMQVPAQAAYDTAEALAALPHVVIPTGDISISADQQSVRIGNACLEMQWRLSNDKMLSPVFTNKLDGSSLELGHELFILRMPEGSEIPSSEFILDGPPQFEAINPSDSSPRLAARLSGMKVVASMTAPDFNLQAKYTAVLLADSHYIRQQLEILPGSAWEVEELVWFSGADPALRAGGMVDGSPALCGDIFLGIEHPMALNQAGASPVQVSQWSPEQMSWPEYVDREWELGDSVNHDGPWMLRFQYTEGAHRIEITTASLVQDGRVLATDEHFGASGIAHVDNEYNFDVSGYVPAGGPVLLAANVRSDLGTDSNGIILLADLTADPLLCCSQPVGVTLEPGRPYRLSAVCGVATPGQMRRAFNRYLELERAHPYRPFLHYNSWYDIGFFNKYDEADCLGVVNAFATELHDKRGVQLDSFLFDDGWDDYDSLWDFHEGFPEGFSNVGAATEAFGAGTGVWLSPWGGYGDPRQQRIAASEGMGYEINEGGFALSGPNYYRRFRDICLQMINDYNANQFKLDGLGRNTSAPAGSQFNSDFDAAISLVGEMRQARSDVFVNLTTGTWPSPFWLPIADSIYRGGWDHEFAGEGSPRQQWITFRDSQTYQNIAKGNPLYPISSLMLHGIIYAKVARDLDTDPQDDLRDEIRSYFGTGTCLQEMYISHELLTERNWDDLAEAAIWSRRHAREMCDVHWYGGDPLDGNVYGWAGWSPDGAVLTLRNPSTESRVVNLDMAELFDLNGLDAQIMTMTCPFTEQRVRQLDFGENGTLSLSLEPFEVLVFSTGD